MRCKTPTYNYCLPDIGSIIDDIGIGIVHFWFASAQHCNFSIWVLMSPVVIRRYPVRTHTRSLRAKWRGEDKKTPGTLLLHGLLFLYLPLLHMHMRPASWQVNNDAAGCVDDCAVHHRGGCHICECADSVGAVRDL
jgi:hypothetical protein